MRVSAFHRSSLGKGLLSVIVGFLNLGLNNFIHFFSIAVSETTAEYWTFSLKDIFHKKSPIFDFLYIQKQPILKKSTLKTMEHVHKR